MTHIFIKWKLLPEAVRLSIDEGNLMHIKKAPEGAYIILVNSLGINDNDDNVF